ncbi:MAG: hypothetical protein CO002_02840 [Candidatus Portnoybacteria bacterium CG_4_8_14_3_um_filter_44_10]|uniref:Uncharacterized protein n=1 Tax=Candidatus Portnoybacteria bacterium CG_4_8_14_3_um_filter_44_10 TaxID=1974802 RepID=A0A2M7IFK5_9BACT|nr:MAG: hypothetical protein CO002_02840 [Candidatus Portnoybacteria bacterium CG_4_8_14_3_um_filter_44_10]
MANNEQPDEDCSLREDSPPEIIVGKIIIKADFSQFAVFGYLRQKRRLYTLFTKPSSRGVSNHLTI